MSISYDITYLIKYNNLANFSIFVLYELSLRGLFGAKAAERLSLRGLFEDTCAVSGAKAHSRNDNAYGTL